MSSHWPWNLFLPFHAIRRCWRVVMVGSLTENHLQYFCIGKKATNRTTQQKSGCCSLRFAANHHICFSPFLPWSQAILPCKLLHHDSKETPVTWMGYLRYIFVFIYLVRDARQKMKRAADEPFNVHKILPIFPCPTLENFTLRSSNKTKKKPHSLWSSINCLVKGTR